MSGGKAFWFWWCLAWALFWITVGWLVLPFLNVFLCGLSAVAALPALVGNDREARCHLCGDAFGARFWDLHMNTKHPGAGRPQPYHGGPQPQPGPRQARPPHLGGPDGYRQGEV